AAGISSSSVLSSRPEVTLGAEQNRPGVLIRGVVETRATGTARGGREDPREVLIKLGVDHLEVEVQVLNRSPGGRSSSLPERGVRITPAARGDLRRIESHASSSEGARTTIHVGADQSRRGTVVVNLRNAAPEEGVQGRGPEVLVTGHQAPGLGQLDIARG